MRKKLALIGFLSVTLTWTLFQFDQLGAYVDALKNNGGFRPKLFDGRLWPNGMAPIGAARPQDEKLERLIGKIKEEAEKRREPPIDARVDRVWKAIPGYNGLEVDVEQTFRLASMRPESEPIPFVYREVPPKINLDDLGAYPIYKGNPKKPMVSIMINVAWGDEYIPKILEVLEKQNVRATFFFDGSWIAKNAETARLIQQKGHEMANHAYSHPQMSRLSRERAVEEITKTQKLLKEQFGVDNKLFAPPSGDYSEETVRIAHELKLKTILWTLDTVDWKNPKPETIVRKITANVEPGSLILMHPTFSASAALEPMIREIRRKKLVLGTVSDLISPKRVPIVESGINF
jgi:probable sporulation protein (polysaccharide deacetylase family)